MADVESHPGPDPAVGASPKRLGPGVLNQSARRQRAVNESREGKLLKIALVSLLIPFGFVLAVWPLVSAKGAASKVALISIPLNLLGWAFITLMSLFSGFPRC